MKKHVAFLLCFLMIFSLASCGAINDKTTVPTETEGTQGGESPQDPGIYDGVLELYTKVLTICGDYGSLYFDAENEMQKLGLEDPDEQQLFRDLVIAVRERYFIKLNNRYPRGPLSHFGYVRKDFNGDGRDELVLLTDDAWMLAVFSVADNRPRAVWIRDNWGKNCWFDETGMLYTSTMHDKPFVGSFYEVYRITPEGSLALSLGFGDSGCKMVWEEPIETVSYTRYKFVDGKKETISEEEYQALVDEHLSSRPFSGNNAVREYIVPFFTPSFCESEMARILLDAALENEEGVYDANGEIMGLLASQFVQKGKDVCRLSDVGPLSYACLDLDGDGTEEVLIDYGEGMKMLRYYEGRIYCYYLPAYRINTDGSYRWRTDEGALEEGESAIAFKGTELKTTELWRTVNDGAQNAEYYLGWKQVSKQELLNHFESTPKAKLEIAPLEAAWINKISQDEATGFAKEYWKEYGFDQSDYSVSLLYHSYSYSWSPSSAYVIVLRKLENDFYYVVDEVWIDKTTGEAIVPYIPEAKG